MLRHMVFSSAEYGRVFLERKAATLPEDDNPPLRIRYVARTARYLFN